MTSRERLGRLVASRREDQGLTQQDLADRAGTTDRLIRSVEKAEAGNRRRSMMRAIATALEWTPDSLDRIMEGLDPVEASHSASVDERLDRLEDQLSEVLALLRQGQPPPEGKVDADRRAG